MALLAGDVLNAARDRHSSFDRRRHPDGVLLRYLSAYVRLLHGKIAAIDPDALRVETEIALPLADHEAGILIPAGRYVAAVVARSSTNNTITQDIPVIPIDQRGDANSPQIAAWQSGDRLFLRSPSTAWGQAGTLGIATIPIPASLSALTSALAVPDTAELVATEATALLMARRGHNDPALPPIDTRLFVAALDEAETAFLADIANRVRPRSIRVRDVWQPGQTGGVMDERRAQL